MSDTSSNNDKNELDSLYNENRKIKKGKKNDISLNDLKIYLVIIICLLIIFIILLLINLFYKLKGPEQIKNISDTTPLNNQILEELLPKINLKEEKISHTLSEIFQSRELFINDKNITPEYIRLLKSLNKKEEEKYKRKRFQRKKFVNYFNESRKGQLNYSEFYYLCKEEKLINQDKIEPCHNPFISIILPTYNKEDELLKSVRSIQNQSFKKIEIIIVDDCSTDNSKKIYKYLLNSDPRIRVFTHQKNMGVWRTRLDGFLYSRGKYIFHFDPGDFYADNFVLEDAYHLAKNYELDSIRFGLREIYSKTNVENINNTKEITFQNELLQIYYGRIDFPIYTVHYGSIWNRLIRSSIFTKGLYLLDEKILNAYKNLWEDRWWNQLANKMVYSNLVVNRVGYLYFRFVTGEGSIKLNSDEQKFKTIKEFIYFLLFDYQISSKKSDKREIIDFLVYLTFKEFTYFDFKINFSYLKERSPILDYLIDCLLNDPFVFKEDKEFLKKLQNKIRKKFE